MLRVLPFALLLLSSASLLSCASDTVVQTGEIRVEFDEDVDFTEFGTFSVVTKEIANPPELDDEQEAFNDMVNAMIVEAMQAEPVCLEYIPPDTTSEDVQPDVWAANGVGRSEEDGYILDCCGGWYWGYWGWYWNPCAYWCPRYVEYEVGSLLVPVGFPPPPNESSEPVAVFAGLAQSVATGTDTEAKIQFAIEEIFKQWPDPRTCP